MGKFPLCIGGFHAKTQVHFLTDEYLKKSSYNN